MTSVALLACGSEPLSLYPPGASATADGSLGSQGYPLAALEARSHVSPTPRQCRYWRVCRDFHGKDGAAGGTQPGEAAAV